MDPSKINHTWSWDKLHEELDKHTVPRAECSTKEYYRTNRNESYPVNLEHDKRGRAIVFTMTGRRSGWQDEVCCLDTMFKSLNIHAAFYNDLNVQGIYKKLQDCANDVTHQADYCMVFFMGHGFSKKSNSHDVYLETGDGDELNIGAACQFIFTRRNSQFINKPKVFLLQTCRKTSDEVAENTTDDDTFSLHETENFLHYLFVYACQPGETARRKRLINFVGEYLIKYACCKHVEDILCKKVSQRFIGTGQMPQHNGTLPFYINLFPGITKRTLGIYSDHISEAVQAEYQPSDHGDVEEAMGINGIDMVMTIKKSCPDSERNRQNALHDMLDCVMKPEKQTMMEEMLSEDLETPVKIKEIHEGSIVIHVSIGDQTALDTFVFLSDTGLLSFKMQMCLVTEDYLALCKTKGYGDVKLNVVIDTNKLEHVPPITEKLPLICSNIHKEIHITCPSTFSREKAEAKWWKDGNRLKPTRKLQLKQQNNKHQMKIKNADEVDAGSYECEYIGTDNRKHLTKCSVKHRFRKNIVAVAVVVTLLAFLAEDVKMLVRVRDWNYLERRHLGADFDYRTAHKVWELLYNRWLEQGAKLLKTIAAAVVGQTLADALMVVLAPVGMVIGAVAKAGARAYYWFMGPPEKVEVGFILSNLDDEEQHKFYDFMQRELGQLDYDDIEELTEILKDNHYLRRRVLERIEEYVVGPMGLEIMN